MVSFNGGMINMKTFISILNGIIVIIQTVILLLFFNEKLPNYPVDLVNIAWVTSALLGCYLGLIYFKINIEITVPLITILVIAIVGLISFPLMLNGNWSIVTLIIMTIVLLHIALYKDKKFAIVPVMSVIMGIYSLGLLLIMKFITSM